MEQHSNVTDISFKVSINCCCTKKMLRSDINLHTCARMQPLYPLLKVMPDASIVLQVKDSREKDRNTPSGRREGRAKWEHQDFSLFYIPPLSFFSFCFLLSPGRYKRRKIELRQTVLIPRYFSPTYRQQVICTVSSALHVPNDFSSRYTYTNTHKACAFMHKQSRSTSSGPLQCFLTGFSYQPALYRAE